MRVGSDTLPFLTVVSIAEDLRGERLEGPPEFWYFLPLAQYRHLFRSASGRMLVRVNGRPEDFVEPLRTRLQQELPGAAYVTAVPYASVITGEQRAWQIGATMFVAFAGLALALSAIGLYSVIAYAVVTRARELGVRLALGADARRMAASVVGQGLSCAAAGIALGGGLALLAGRWVEPLLFGVSPRDATVFAWVAATLMLTAVVATLIPAARATRVDPASSLRVE